MGPTAGNTGSTGSSGTTISNIQGFIKTFIDFINQYLIPLLFAVAFLFFLYGAFKFFILGPSRGDEEAAKQGQQFMIWSVVGFVLMFSLWGIVNLITGTFQLNNNQPKIPTLQNTSASGASTAGTNGATTQGSPSGTISGSSGQNTIGSGVQNDPLLHEGGHY